MPLWRNYTVVCTNCLYGHFDFCIYAAKFLHHFHLQLHLLSFDVLLNSSCLCVSLVFLLVPVDLCYCIELVSVLFGLNLTHDKRNWVRAGINTTCFYYVFIGVLLKYPSILGKISGNVPSLSSQKICECSELEHYGNYWSHMVLCTTQCPVLILLFTE